MTTIASPERMGRRSQARLFVDSLTDDVSEQRVTVVFADDSLGTPSFVDELVIALLRDRNVAGLQLCGLPDELAEVAGDAADRVGLADRLSLA